jgi:hypothetical protein
MFLRRTQIGDKSGTQVSRIQYDRRLTSEVLVTKHQMIWAVLGLSFTVAAPARADLCIVAHQQAVFCSGTNGCTGSATSYNCYGYGTAQTCSCYNVSCCGHAVGPDSMTCGTQCTGCQPDGKTTPQVAKNAGTQKTASRQRTNQGRPTQAASPSKATKPVGVGPTDGGGH